VSEDLKVGARKARASNIARWFILNYPTLEGSFVPSSKIREGIPTKVKKPNLDRDGDKRAHGDAINELGLSSVRGPNGRLVDMSLPNLKRCVSYQLGSRIGALYIKAPKANEDLELIDELEKVCKKKTLVFNKLDGGAKAFINNLVVNYPKRIKDGWVLSDKQRSWALDLITENR
jgi:hypothetical protein